MAYTLTEKLSSLIYSELSSTAACYCLPVMSVSCSRIMGGGLGGVVSVCTDPGGVMLRRAVEMELLRFLGVVSILGCSAGVVNSRGGNGPGE